MNAAAANGQTAVVDRLILAKADIEARDKVSELLSVPIFNNDVIAHFLCQFSSAAYFTFSVPDPAAPAGLRLQ